MMNYWKPYENIRKKQNKIVDCHSLVMCNNAELKWYKAMIKSVTQHSYFGEETQQVDG
jgi:hypothetical protein